MYLRMDHETMLLHITELAFDRLLPPLMVGEPDLDVVYPNVLAEAI